MKDKFFLSTVVISLIGTAIYVGDGLLMWEAYLISAIISILNTICVLVLFTSYKKHQKNVMKGMMGSLLMGLITHGVAILIPFDPETPAYNILAIINLFILVGLALNHYIINTEHYSNPAGVYLNQILVVAEVLTFICAGIACLPGYDVYSIVHLIGMIMLVVGNMSVIVCIETRLDAYRIDREKAGWTEEKGYPKGYVHMFERLRKKKRH